MPVSHVGLTVSHLPTSCSFFLSALQPLGYRFIGQWGNQIGLGIEAADFFLTQETPGIKAGAAHVAFSAPNRTGVRNFYANALQAGGRPHGSPSTRDDGSEIFNAAVLDMDGNSVEVVYHQDGLDDDAASYTGQSRVLTWNKDVAASLGDNKSVVSINSLATTARNLKALVPANSAVARTQAPSVAQSVTSRSKAPSVAHSAVSKSSPGTRTEPFAVQRSFTAPVLGSQKSGDSFEISKKTLVGTILGAAAGAAVAYAMCKSEEDSAKAEEAAYHAVQRSSQQLQASHPYLLEGPPSYTSQARVIRSASEAGSYYDETRSMRAIEAPSPPPPSGYQHPSYSTAAPSRHHDHLSSSGRSRVSLARSNTLPEARPKNTLDLPIVPPETQREPSEGSRQSSRSHHSSHSHHTKPSSSHTKSHRSSSRSQSRHNSPAPSLSRILKDHAAPVRGSSVLGRNYEAEPYLSSSGENYNNNNDNDADTVAPSDSISCAGDSTRRKKKSSRAPSATSHHSSSRDDARRNSESGKSEESKHSSKHRKHKSSVSGRSESGSRARKSSHDKTDADEIVMTPDEISEVGSESTMTPDKYKSGGSKGKIKGKKAAPGSAMSLPIRGITPSMIHGDGRSVVSYYC
ncbi:hypothetical protein EJ08DRAFT_698082 [Tothia fuscella]|uniref:VOC domain-containing protein n=1 Tax=Tothia fuscella TaxID=1048955 RepID=A0A9P4NQ39_9PEZI|nr:hypothetical protein EJ08DRAFT_698082 [Tothia fuscella]